MTKHIVCPAAAFLAVTASCWCGEPARPADTNRAQSIAEMASWYKPGHFDSSTFYLIASSHNDIAYLDDPKGTADFRAENLIGPALDLMKLDNSFALDVDSTLFLKEYLERCPERIDEGRPRPGARLSR